MSILDILKIVDDADSLQQIEKDMEKSVYRSDTFEARISDTYEQFNFGKKHANKQFGCTTPTKCLEKIILDKRTVEFLLKKYNSSKSVEAFNEWIGTEIYDRIIKLLRTFSPPVKGTYNQSYKQHL